MSLSLRLAENASMNTFNTARTFRALALSAILLLLLSLTAFVPVAHAQSSSQIECGFLGMLDTFGMPVSSTSLGCASNSNTNASSTNPTASTDNLISGAINDALSGAGLTASTTASSTIDVGSLIPPIFPYTLNIDTGSVGVTGTIDPLTGLFVNVSTPFGNFDLRSDECEVRIVKIVNGGPASPSDFQIHLRNNGVDVAGSPKPGSSSGTSFGKLLVNATSTYSVAETGGPAGYTATFGGACDANGVLSLSGGQGVTCTVINTFTGTSTGTTTPPGGGGPGTTTPPGGGGGEPATTTPPGGGGGGPPGDGGGSNVSSGGGGGGGGGGSGSNPPGQVLGATTVPVGIGGFLPEVPGVPNTGTGGFAAVTIAILLGSALVAALGGISLKRHL